MPDWLHISTGSALAPRDDLTPDVLHIALHGPLTPIALGDQADLLHSIVTSPHEEVLLDLSRVTEVHRQAMRVLAHLADILAHQGRRLSVVAAPAS
jgi:hypothetical protein